MLFRSTTRQNPTVRHERKIHGKNLLITTIRATKIRIAITAIGELESLQARRDQCKIFLGDPRWNCHLIADISNTAVTEVAEGAFDNNQLTDAKLPSSVKTVGIRAFNGNKFGSITLGDGVEKIGVYAYGNNSKLASVSISKNLKSLHGDAFYLYPNNRPKVKVNIREKRNPNDLKDLVYHVEIGRAHV